MFDFTMVQLCWVLLFFVCMCGGLVMTVIKMQNRRFCTRCAKPMPDAELVEFLGVKMCEPCENIASYYDQIQ
jgi:hypothetical protein